MRSLQSYSVLSNEYAGNWQEARRYASNLQRAPKSSWTTFEPGVSEFQYNVRLNLHEGKKEINFDFVFV